MAWLAVDKDGTEAVYQERPYRRIMTNDWSVMRVEYIILPTGSVDKLIGRNLTWDDEPVEIE